VSEQELRQVLKLNKKLAWFPRFRIRNLITPRFLQALMRAGQLGEAGKPGKHGLAVENRIIAHEGAQVRVRIIRPKGQSKGVVLDYHGGGWVVGNPQMNDDLNIAMVEACQVTVVSVDYRLAVTTPVADILEDCLCAARWLLDGERTEFAGLPVIMVGESAGGHLAAATLLALKESPVLLERISGALLYYGVYDLTGTPSVRRAPRSTLVLDGPGLVEAFRMLTPGLNDQQRRQPLLSPLYGDFTGLPPALMFVGELDPLKDDTFDLAEQWLKSAPVEAHLLPSCPHGFIHFPTAMAERVLAYSHQWITARIDG
jgi:acetyl esterase/lipase